MSECCKLEVTLSTYVVENRALFAYLKWQTLKVKAGVLENSKLCKKISEDSMPIANRMIVTRKLFDVASYFG
jgi:hypothetical protein